MSDPTKIYNCPVCTDGYIDGCKCLVCQGSGYVCVTMAPRVTSDRQENTKKPGPPERSRHE